MTNSALRATMIDNYDSFTYNLVQYFYELGVDVTTIRNDAITAAAVLEAKPDFIVLSPGPSSPEHAGICLELIRAVSKRVLPLLGVCLGHQAIASAFGGRVLRAGAPVHGKTSLVYHGGKGVFRGLPTPFSATRYHSLMVERHTLPMELQVTAETSDGMIMGLRHATLPIEGVQFHPESILTEHGKAMLANFLETVRCGYEPGSDLT